MTVALKFAKDSQGYTTFAATPADVILNANMLNGVEDSITVPSVSAYYTVAFNYQPGTTFWVDVTGATAVAPIVGTLESATSVLNPSSYLLPAAATISVITSNDTADLSISMWQGGTV